MYLVLSQPPASYRQSNKIRDPWNGASVFLHSASRPGWFPQRERSWIGHTPHADSPESGHQHKGECRCSSALKVPPLWNSSLLSGNWDAEQSILSSIPEPEHLTWESDPPIYAATNIFKWSTWIYEEEGKTSSFFWLLISLIVMALSTIFGTHV